MTTSSRRQVKNLSPTMHRTLAKLTNTWQSPKQLGESINTLQALCKRNLAECEWRLGFIQPEYRKKGK